MADLFAGIGGFHLAFEEVGGQVVFAAENDRHARTTYEANFRSRNPHLFDHAQFAADITTVAMARVPEVDVVTAGFPCQPFSYAGQRRGFDDVRGTLFFEIAQILEKKRPAAFFLENVPGILSQDHGRAFDTIRSVLTNQLNYSFHWKIVRACDHGLPQLRPRVFMVGFRNTATPFQFPDPVPLSFTLSDLLGGHVDRDIARSVLASHYDKRHGTPFWWSAYLVDGIEHRLTLDEVRQLQGFPSWFTFPVSIAQARKQLGNAVAVPAAAATARAIVDALHPNPAGHDTPTSPHPHH